MLSYQFNGYIPSYLAHKILTGLSSGVLTNTVLINLQYIFKTINYNILLNK